MIDNPFYAPEFHGPYELFSLGDFVLEEGYTLRDCRLAYATFGELNEAKDNAILVTTWYSGTHQIMRDVYIGPGRALNPEEYFIVAINQIGNGLSSSPHNTDGTHAMAGFPRVRIGDDVRAQERLLRELFGIERLELVVGGSMGAQQTYEWAVRFPEKVKRAAPIAGTARNTPHDFIYTQALVETITSDPAFEGGWYEGSSGLRSALARHARIWSVMGFSTEFWKQERWRPLGFASADDFQVGFVGRLLRPDGSERPALHGLEVAARRRQPPHGGRPRRRPGPHLRQNVRDAHRRGHVLPPARLRRRAKAHTEQRAARHRKHGRPPGPVRLRRKLHTADRPASGGASFLLAADQHAPVSSRQPTGF